MTNVSLSVFLFYVYGDASLLSSPSRITSPPLLGLVLVFIQIEFTHKRNA